MVCSVLDGGGDRAYSGMDGKEEKKNTLADLNNYLFEQIERLNDDTLDADGLDRELKKADAVIGISEKILQTGELAFKTWKHMDDFGYGNVKTVPKMLANGEDWK